MGIFTFTEEDYEAGEYVARCIVSSAVFGQGNNGKVQVHRVTDIRPGDPEWMFAFLSVMLGCITNEKKMASATDTVLFSPRSARNVPMSSTERSARTLWSEFVIWAVEDMEIELALVTRYAYAGIAMLTRQIQRKDALAYLEEWVTPSPLARLFATLHSLHSTTHSPIELVDLIVRFFHPNASLSVPSPPPPGLSRPSPPPPPPSLARIGRRETTHSLPVSVSLSSSSSSSSSSMSNTPRDTFAQLDLRPHLAFLLVQTQSIAKETYTDRLSVAYALAARAESASKRASHRFSDRLSKLYRNCIAELSHGFGP